MPEVAIWLLRVEEKLVPQILLLFRRRLARNPRLTIGAKQHPEPPAEHLRLGCQSSIRNWR